MVCTECLFAPKLLICAQKLLICGHKFFRFSFLMSHLGILKLKRKKKGWKHPQIYELMQVAQIEKVNVAFRFKGSWEKQAAVTSLVCTVQWSSTKRMTVKWTSEKKKKAGAFCKTPNCTTRRGEKKHKKSKHKPAFFMCFYLTVAPLWVLINSK